MLVFNKSIKMLPQIINGMVYSDDRGKLYYNNSFDFSQIKRIYFIENKDIDFVRGWIGHKIEKRWFSAATGSFEITLITVDNWEQPSQNLKQQKFIISSESLDILHVPAGYISSIRSLVDNSKLLVMADYGFGEIKDEYRYDINYFNKNS